MLGDATLDNYMGINFIPDFRLAFAEIAATCAALGAAIRASIYAEQQRSSWWHLGGLGRCTRALAVFPLPSLTSGISGIPSEVAEKVAEEVTREGNAAVVNKLASGVGGDGGGKEPLKRWAATKALLSCRMNDGWAGYWQRLRRVHPNQTVYVPDANRVSWSNGRCSSPASVQLIACRSGHRQRLRSVHPNETVCVPHVNRGSR